MLMNSFQCEVLAAIYAGRPFSYWPDNDYNKFKRLLAFVEFGL